jgi:hypothetical protein
MIKNLSSIKKEKKKDTLPNLKIEANWVIIANLQTTLTI